MALVRSVGPDRTGPKAIAGLGLARAAVEIVANDSWGIAQVNGCSVTDAIACAKPAPNEAIADQMRSTTGSRVPAPRGSQPA